MIEELTSGGLSTPVAVFITFVCVTDIFFWSVLLVCEIRDKRRKKKLEDN